MKLIRINKDGSMNDLNIKFTKKNLLSQLNKNASSKGNDKINELYYWNYNSNNIKCYGWYDGEAGFENKHDLPPNGISKFLEEESSEKLLFGDLFIICFENDNLKDLCVSDYAIFYDELFEGFDNCSSSDSESDDNENSSQYL